MFVVKEIRNSAGQVTHIETPLRDKHLSSCAAINKGAAFSPEEREYILQKRSVKPFTLSRNILRSDTAVISAISLVNFINNFH